MIFKRHYGHFVNFVPNAFFYLMKMRKYGMINLNKIVKGCKIMDSICEQLIKMKKSAKDYALLTAIWVGAFVLVYALVLLSLKYTALMGLLIVAVFGIFYGAIRLSKMLSVEYEYILVNHDMDIDKIIGKSSRKRIVSVKLNEVEEFGRYDDNKAKLASRRFDNKYFFCNADDEAYYLVVRHSKRGLILVVTAMSERTREAALKFIPRIAK